MLASRVTSNNYIIHFSHAHDTRNTRTRCSMRSVLSSGLGFGPRLGRDRLNAWTSQGH